MRIVFDPQKRAGTLRQRGLDFIDAPNVFAGACFTFGDERFAYSEPRYIPIGLLGGRWWSWCGRPTPKSTARDAVESFR
jgi:uncharacterized protein